METLPIYSAFPEPVILQHDGIRVTHTLDLPPDEDNPDGWRWYIIHEEDVKKAFDHHNFEIVYISDDAECSESVLEEWEDYDPSNIHAYS